MFHAQKMSQKNVSRNWFTISWVNLFHVKHYLVSMIHFFPDVSHETYIKCIKTSAKIDYINTI